MALKRATSWTATILLVAVLLVFVALAGLILTGYKPEVIVSGSMRPMLDRGSLVFVRPTPATKLKVGQIISFQHPFKKKAYLVTHRIHTLRQTPGGPVFTTKGDNNPTPDPWNLQLHKEAGLYAFSIPYVGKLSFLVGTTSGYIILFAIPMLLLMIFGLVKIWTSPPPSDEDEESPSPPPATGVPVFGYPREV